MPVTRSVAPAAPITTRPFEAGDEPGVLDVLQKAFGSWPLDTNGADPAQFFRWKHRESPFGPSILVVAEADAAVVGFCAWMPWPLIAGGEVQPALRGVDIAVHPSHRGRGLSTALIREAQTRFPDDLALSFSTPNELSRPGILRTGRRHAGDLPSYIRPSRPLRGAIHLVVRRSTRSGDLRLEAPNAAKALADPAASPLVKQISPPRDRITTVKDLEYLRWRYGKIEDYRAVRVEADGAMAGLAIFRVRRNRSARVTRVCELLVAEDDRRLGGRLLRAVRAAAPTEFISCRFRSRRAAALFGFVPSPRGTALLANPLRPDLSPDPTRHASWGLSLGDLELI